MSHSLVPGGELTLIFAHPDDELLFFLHTLKKLAPKKLHLVCVTGRFSRIEEIRLAELSAFADHLKADLIQMGLEARRGQHLAADALFEGLRQLNIPSYGPILTHGPFGEYGHTHHVDVFRAVTAHFASRVWCLSGPLSSDFVAEGDALEKKRWMRTFYPSQGLEDWGAPRECLSRVASNPHLQLLLAAVVDKPFNPAKAREFLNLATRRYFGSTDALPIEGRHHRFFLGHDPAALGSRRAFRGMALVTLGRRLPASNQRACSDWSNGVNVLFILPRHPNFYSPYMYHEMAWMQSQGHRLALLSLHKEPETEIGMADFGLSEVPVLQVPWVDGVSDAELLDVLRFVEQNHIEVMHARSGRWTAQMATLIKAETGVPFAVKLHGGEVHWSPPPYLPEVLDAASAVCPVSYFLCDLLIGKQTQPQLQNSTVLPLEIDPAKLRVCENSIPNRFIAEREVRQRHDQQIIAASGRMIHAKRFADTLQAVANLVPEFPGIGVCIIGGGEALADFKALAEALDIGDRVEFTGAKPWLGVIETLRRCHIYVHASPLEGFCMGMLEAAAQGLPLLLTPTGAHTDIIGCGECGSLFEAENVDDLTSKLQTILRCCAEDRQKMGAAALARVRERFSLEHQMSHYEAILQAVVRSKAAPSLPLPH